MAASANYHLSPPADNYYYYHELPSSYYPHRQTPTVPVFGYFQPGYLVISQTGIPLYPQGQPHPSNFGPSTINHPARFSGRAESNGYHWFITCDGSRVLNSQEAEYGPQPYQSDRFSSGRSADGSYRQFMPFNSSWVFNSQGEYGPQPYHSDRFSGRAADGNYSQYTACDGCCSVHNTQGQRQLYSSRYNRNVTIHRATFSGRPENSNYGEALILGAIEEEEEEEHATMTNEEEISHWVEDHVVVSDSADVENEGLCEETTSKNFKPKDGHPESDSKICVVCQDCLNQEDKKIAGLDCGHDFHARCITTWLRVKNSCPLCKATAICL